MPSPACRNSVRARVRKLAVVNLAAQRATKALEHQGSKETGRNAKPEMVSVNGIELRQHLSVVA